MAKKSYLYVVRDEYRMPVSICASKKMAQKQLMLLAKHTEWNRHWKIKEIRDSVIYFGDFDHDIDFIEIPYLGTKKDFMIHFGFIEDYSKFMDV